MNEEEKETIKYFYNLRATIDESNMLFEKDINVKHGKETIRQITIILNLIENQQKELNNLKEIEKSHKEENEKLRVELEQEKERNELYILSGSNINLERHIKNNYISKDKIKEKYLDMEKEYARKVYDNNYNRTEVKKEEMYKRQVYEELLEEAE